MSHNFANAWFFGAMVQMWDKIMNSDKEGVAAGVGVDVVCGAADPGVTAGATSAGAGSACAGSLCAGSPGAGRWNAQLDKVSSESLRSGVFQTFTETCRTGGPQRWTSSVCKSVKPSNSATPKVPDASTSPSNTSRACYRSRGQTKQARISDNKNADN
jgi:hypothetical protein